jgi:UDP-glucose 4-epimerase
VKSGESILVTGGAGYIGSHINLELHRRGYKTVVLDNLHRGHRELVHAGEYIAGDVTDAAVIKTVLSRYNIAAVMHFAALTYVGESVAAPAEYYTNNVAGTLNLLNCMREACVEPFIFSSTCAVYGEPHAIPIPETAPMAPINPYGRSKLMVEMLLADFAHAYDLRYVSLRYFNAAGADAGGEIGEWHEPETHLIPLVLDAAYDADKTIQIYGTDYPTPDGTCIRDYIHVTDLAEAHILALEYLLDGGQSEVFNLGNGNGHSVREVIDAARKVTGQKIPSMAAVKRPGDPPVLVADAKKIKQSFGWSPRHPDLEFIIATAWRWIQRLKKS